MSDNTEQERAVANALSVCVDGMPKPNEHDWADAKRLIAYLSRAGYVRAIAPGDTP